MSNQTSDAQMPVYTEGYKKYVLLALMGVYIFNFIDRQILVILQESIKTDLGLSDTQLGLLTGLAFAIFYVVLGLPIARLADKYSRRKIISIALVVWSLMTAISGLTANFFQLLLARIGVGIGEAGASPPAHSMISDYFPPEKRARAISVYSLGIYIGILLGYLFGGWLDEFFGWRTALMVLGLPGVIYAIFFFFTVKEPPRGYAENKQAEAKQMPTLGSVMHILFTRRSFLYIALGAGVNSFVLYGVGNWTPSFLARTHSMASGEIGTWLALSVGLGGALGVWLGGYYGDKWGKIDPKWYMLFPAIAIAISIPVTLTLILAQNKYLCLAAVALSKICWSTYLAPCIAMSHGLVGIRMRALASAVLFLFLNLIGLGLGPLFFGALSDYYQPSLGSEALGTSLLFAVIASAMAVWLFWRAANLIKNDLAMSVA